MRRMVMGAAAICMVVSTVVPFLYGFSERSVNVAIGWFWGAWSIAFAWFLIQGVGAFLPDRTFIRARTVNLALALMFLGLDTIRIRTDLFADLVDPGPSTWQAWLIRAYAGWSTVVFVSMFRPAQRAEELPKRG